MRILVSGRWAHRRRSLLAPGAACRLQWVVADAEHSGGARVRSGDLAGPGASQPAEDVDMVGCIVLLARSESGGPRTLLAAKNVGLLSVARGPHAVKGAACVICRRCRSISDGRDHPDLNVASVKILGVFPVHYWAGLGHQAEYPVLSARDLGSALRPVLSVKVGEDTQRLPE